MIDRDTNDLSRAHRNENSYTKSDENKNISCDSTTDLDESCPSDITEVYAPDIDLPESERTSDNLSTLTDINEASE